MFEKIDKMDRTKENAFLHGLAMFCRSWTFEKLTVEEKEDCINCFLFAYQQGMIKGTFDERIRTMNAIYNGFLSALGYSRDPISWRSEIA